MRRARALAAVCGLLALLPGSPAWSAEDAGVSCENSTQCARELSYGQVCHDGHCQEYLDETDIFIAVGLSQKSHGPPKAYEPLFAFLPAFAYNPSVGFLFGAVGIFGIVLGDPKTTTISSVQAIALYTTKSQFISSITSTILTEENGWEFQGDWRFLIFNQDTYGLGTGTTPVSTGFTIGGVGTTAGIPGGQPMDFSLVRFHQNALKKVWGNLYVGPGVSFDRYYAIDDESLNLSATPPVVTSHYAYSRVAGFPTGQYNESGLNINVLFDSRDSTINAYRGMYANISYQWNPTWFGSTQNSTFLYTEFRYYLGLSDAVPRNVLAFWFIGQGVLTDKLPYLALPAIGWDARNRSGRGFIQGRFRGTAWLYYEMEWRFRITDNGLLGGVVFSNVSTFSRPASSYQGTSEPGQSLFQNFAVAGGFGLRIMMNRLSRTNITLDLAVGQKTWGFYFGAGEAF